MKSLAQVTIDSTINAWEYYCEENYDKLELLAETENSPEIQDLCAMAEIEKFPERDVFSSGTGLFSPLVDGISAYYKMDFISAASALGNWLQNKEYYSPGIINKFCDSALRSKNYSLLGKVSKKFLEMRNYRNIVAEPIFRSLFQTGKYKESLIFFERYNDSINSEELIQKAAFAMIQLDRFKEAEQLLISLFEKVTGTTYHLDYESVKEKYAKKISLIQKLESKKELTREESMDLGMIYLFNGKYKEAMKVFDELSKEHN